MKSCCNWKIALFAIVYAIIATAIIFLIKHFVFETRTNPVVKVITYELIDFPYYSDKIPSELGNVLPNPNNNECGQHNLSNKTLNNFHANIDEFPWTVLLKYKINDTFEFRCGGSIINQRYVLTAAHCLFKLKEELVSLEAVRLGERDLTKEVPCDKISETQNKCANKPLEVGIEEIIPYPIFDIKRADQLNDIALIRLNQTITFSDYIKPICLHETKTLNEAFYLAGWDRTSKNATVKEIKHVIQLYEADRKDCVNKYQYSLPIFVASKLQICLLQENDYKSFCMSGTGNSAVTKNNNSLWYAEAIDSFGKECEQTSWPGIYTEIWPYYDWITANLRL